MHLLRKKVVRANHDPYVTKTLRKAIMKRPNLQKIYFKKKTADSLKKYKKQKNYYSRLYKKERNKFFSNLDSSKIYVTIKHFGKLFNLFFLKSEKLQTKLLLWMKMKH